MRPRSAHLPSRRPFSPRLGCLVPNIREADSGIGLQHKLRSVADARRSRPVVPPGLAIRTYVRFHSRRCNSPSTRSTGSSRRSRSAARSRPPRRRARSSRSRRSPTGSPARCWRRSPRATVASPASARPSRSPASTPTRRSRRRSSSSSTSRRPASRLSSCRICEIGAVRVRGFELVDTFESLVNPGVKLPPEVARLTGLRDPDLRRAPAMAGVLRRFLAFAGDDLLVAHNAKFDQRFLERQLLMRHGRRLSEPPLCTAALAKRVLERPCQARRPRLARALLRRPHDAVPPCSPRRGGDRPGARAPHGPGAGARRQATLRPAHARRAAQAPRPRQAPARPPGADPPGRLPLPRQARPGALRRPRARPARPPAHVLPERPSAAVGRGRPARARAHRVARARLRARGRLRGAAPDPRAPAARELTQPAHAPRPLPEAPRRRACRYEDADEVRPDWEPPQGVARRPRALVGKPRRARGAPRRRPAATDAQAARAPLRLAALRGGGAAPRPHRRGRARRRPPPPARAAAAARALRGSRPGSPSSSAADTC